MAAGANVRLRLESGEEFADFMHFLAACLRQRAFVIRLFPIRPIGLPMTEKIKSHMPRCALSDFHPAFKEIGKTYPKAFPRSVMLSEAKHL